MADEETPKAGFAPSNSTTASAVGGAVATIVIGILGQFHITFAPGFEAAIAVLVAVAAGYLPESGRK